jgi:hypothetical protein
VIGGRRSSSPFRWGRGGRGGGACQRAGLRGRGGGDWLRHKGRRGTQTLGGGDAGVCRPQEQLPLPAGPLRGDKEGGGGTGPSGVWGVWGFTRRPHDHMAVRLQVHFLSANSTVVCVRCLQGPGEVLFVPSGWHHCVINEGPCLSINHNWLNGHNIHHSWTLLQHEHALATQQLEDCRCVDRWTACVHMCVCVWGGGG